jgi:hypothetical protein
MKKSVIDQLAHSLGRRDEAPNILLAERIADQEDKIAIKELVALTKHKLIAIKYDAIKVLYEVGARKPELINRYCEVFLTMLAHKDNRIQWGGMTALSVISGSKPELLAHHIINIVDAMDQGSVITRDHGIYILSNLGKIKKHHANCMELLLEQVEKAPVNQMPMYAEKTAEIITPPYLRKLLQIIQSREDVLAIPSKKKRLDKLVKKLRA